MKRKPTAKDINKPLSLADQKSLELMLADFGIWEWDVVIIGDGSGSMLGLPVGWGSVSVERATGDRRIWSGAMNAATVNVAEIMAFLQPLNWYATRALTKFRETSTYVTTRIYIFTDSEYCSTSPRRKDRAGGPNAILWSAFDILRAQGIFTKFHWISREASPLHQFADRLSKLSRIAYDAQDVPAATETSTGINVYEANPSEADLPPEE